MNLYSNLLQPELYYDKPEVARFIETLNEPEIESASCDQIQRLEQEMMATDDINTIAGHLATEAREIVSNTGTIPPRFVGYLDQEHRVKFCPNKIPTNSESVKRFLEAGKALGLSRTAQCIFFITMQPLKDDEPVFGEETTELCPWGILVVGSSLRGNCFVRLERIIRGKKLDFEVINHTILREGQYNYPYSKFFHIKNYNEMGDVIKQILKLTGIPEKECFINFLTTLKALDLFGYAVNGIA